MTVEEAIKTALEYGAKVRDSYPGAIDSIKDETGQHVFKVLGEEEQETAHFHTKMVAEMNENEGRLFARFLEIEEGHQVITLAELDYLNKSGTFFDFQEFSMES